jgi:hypothetical protein
MQAISTTIHILLVVRSPYSLHRSFSESHPNWQTSGSQFQSYFNASLRLTKQPVCVIWQTAWCVLRTSPRVRPAPKTIVTPATS